VGVASLVGEGLRVPEEVGARKKGRFGDGGRLFVVLFAASFGVRGDAVLRLGGIVGLTALFRLPTLLRAEDMVIAQVREDRVISDHGLAMSDYC